MGRGVVGFICLGAVACGYASPSVMPLQTPPTETAPVEVTPPDTPDTTVDTGDALTTELPDTVEPEITPPVVRLTPSQPTSSDELRLVFEHDLGPGQYRTIRWFVDGVLWDEQRTTVAAEETKRGEVWRAEVFVHDERRISEPSVVEVVIANSPPWLFDLETHPALPRDPDDLQVTFQCFDVDDDRTEATVHWILDGQVVVAGDETAWVPADLTTTGDVWQIKAWCDDGTDRSTNSAGAFITVL